MLNAECCTLFHGMSGEIAAVGTAMFFAVGSTFFTLAGRRAGASVVNRPVFSLPCSSRSPSIG